MEENVVLQVVLHEDNGLEIRMGNSKVSNYTLIGIIEQIKMNILTDALPEPVDINSSKELLSKKYDA